MRSLWIEIKYIKSAAKVLNRHFVNKRGFDLFKNLLLWVSVGHLQAVKVGFKKNSGYTSRCLALMTLHWLILIYIEGLTFCNNFDMENEGKIDISTENAVILNLKSYFTLLSNWRLMLINRGLIFVRIDTRSYPSVLSERKIT